MVNTLTNLIRDAVIYHEARITLDNLDVSQAEADAGLLLISLEYTVRATNSRFNMVYPFYINEAASR
jgi:phage baseplate assembly protein W